MNFAYVLWESGNFAASIDSDQPGLYGSLQCGAAVSGELAGSHHAYWRA
jgi:hypothetical protein